MIFLYVTYPSLKLARKAAKGLLKKRLIACANMLKSHSVYTSNGRLAEGPEYIAIFKAPSKNRPKVHESIGKNHPYKVPCIIEIPAKGNAEYEQWLQKTCFR